MPQSHSPLEAPLLPESKPRKSWVPLIMVGMLSMAGILAVVLLCGGFVWLVDQAQPGRMQFTGNAAQWPSRLEKQAEYRAVFKVPADVPVDPALPQIEKMLNRYIAAVRQNDKGGLARLIDVDAFLRRMDEHPDMPRLDSASRRALVEMLNRELQLPESVVQFHLMSVRREGKSEAVVDVVLKNSRGTSDPCRLWLKQSERAWAVVDWEQIDQGKSEAAKWASSQRAGRDWLAHMHQSFLDDLSRADRCYSTGDNNGAVSALAATRQRQIPGYVQRELQMAVGQRFYMYGQFQRAIDALQSIDVPDEVPGVFVLQALCYQSLGEATRAAQAADQYEQLCGFAPDVARAKAWALAELKKTDEAIVELKKLLQFDPTDHLALQQLMEILPAGQKGQVVDLVALAKDPPQAALALVNNYLLGSDEESMQAIRLVLEKKFKDSPATHVFVARLHEIAEEHDLAAAAYRRAHDAEQDPATKSAYWRDYVRAMMAAGKLVKAYEESPDPAAIFAYLTEGMDDEESMVSLQDLAPLVEAHRRRAPNDPQLKLLLGYLAREKGDLPAAEAEYAAGESQTSDEDLKDRYRYARLDVLASQGRFLDAYRDYESDASAFPILAGRCRQQQKLDVLEELVRRRKAKEPKDPEVEYFEAALEIDRGQYPQALKRLLARLENSTEEDDEEFDASTYRWQWLRLEIYEKYDQWQQTLPQDPEYGKLWPQLAQRFIQAEEWGKLSQLLGVQLMHGGGGAQHHYYEMQLNWHLGHPSQVTRPLQSWDSTYWSALPQHEQKWVRETLVRAYLRQGQVSAAFNFAEQFQRENSDELPMLLVRIAQRDAAQVKEQLTRLDRQLYYNLAQDAELLPLLTDSRFAELRRERPFGLPRGGRGFRLVLFLGSPRLLTPESIAALLPEVAVDRISALPAVGKDSQSFAITHPRGTLFLTSGSGRYETASGGQLTSNIAAQSAVKNELAAHQGWLSLDLLDSPVALTQRRDDDFARRSLLRLLEGEVLAVGYAEDSGQITILPRGAFHPEQLGQSASWKGAFRGGERLWWGDYSDEESGVSQSATRKELRGLIAELPKLPAGQFAQVKVRLGVGHSVEEHWLKVISAERKNYEFTLVGEFQQPSAIWPHLQAGERCKLSSWEVKEIKLP